MSTGADPKTMAVTKEYEDGFKRTFGDKKPQRGRWVMHPVTHKLVPADEYVRPSDKALHAPIITDRFYEGTHAVDAEKTDIGSRRKRREYMKRNGLIDADDVGPSYQARVRAERQREREQRLERTVMEAFHRPRR
jgi:hypothetical protein